MHIKRAAVGVNIDGIFTTAVLLAETGEVIARRKVLTPHSETSTSSTAERVTNQVAELVTQLTDQWTQHYDVAQSVGLAVNGPVNETQDVGGTQMKSPRVHSALAEMTREKLHERPVHLRNNVTASGVAEHKLGAGAGYTDLIIVTVSNSIACTIITNNSVVLGQGTAGEIGHIDTGTGISCPCGARGCLTQTASASAITRTYNQSVRNTTVSIAHGSEDVWERVSGGDAAAARVWVHAQEHLADALATLVTVLSPQLIILAGELSAAGPTYARAMQDAVLARLTFQVAPAFALALLGDEASAVGAGLLALEKEQLR
jgi:glucokinase